MGLDLVQILAMTMHGEAAIINDVDALAAVAHVFLNRLYSDNFPNTPQEVAEKFNAFRYVDYGNVPLETLLFAQHLAYSRSEYPQLDDLTNGCLYIVSWQDLVKLNNGDMKEALYLAIYADWISNYRVIGGTFYRLYAYKQYPSKENYPDILGIKKPLAMLEP